MFARSQALLGRGRREFRLGGGSLDQADLPADLAADLGHGLEVEALAQKVGGLLRIA